MSTPRLQALLDRAASVVLRLYPSSFRARYGADVAEVFTDMCLVRAGGRRGRLLAVGGRALLGMARSGLSERFGRNPQPRYHIPHGRSGRHGDSLVSSFLQDIRFALRSLAKRPAFTALVVGMLALGVAANTAIFSGLNSVVLRPMPFAEPDRLVLLDEVAPDWGLESVSVSYPDFHYWEAENRTFESMAVFDDQSFNLSVDGRPDRVRGALVHWRLLHVLGLQPMLGRDFTEADYAEGAEPTALVAERFWRERMDGRADALGDTLRINGAEFTVIGVLPPEAVLPANAEIWTLLSSTSFCCDLENTTGSWWLSGIGRLAPGVSIEQALEDLRAVHSGLVEILGGSREIATPRLDPLHELLVEDMRPMLLLLLGAVGILLLIACANVGGLMMARAAGRGREMGVRAALGAARGRLVRQLLTESLIIATVGGVVGGVVGHLAISQLFRAMPEEVRGWISIQADWRFFAFAVGLAAVTTVAFGLVPALQSARTSPQVALREGGHRGSDAAQKRTLSFLVVAEVALAVVLLVGAALLVSSFVNLVDRDLGFRDDPLTLSVSLPDAIYPDRDATVEFWRSVQEQVAALPGVAASGITTLRPLAGHTGYFFNAEDATALSEDQPNPVILTRFATADYFDTMGITFVHGESYPDDQALQVDDEFGVVVNETFARTFWGEVNVVGRRIHSGSDDDPWHTIVGVVADTLHYGPGRPMRPGVFVPFWSHFGGARDRGTLVLRAERGDANALVADVRALVGRIDPDMPLFSVGTMRDHLSTALWGERLYAGLLGTFAGAALLLALGGIYSTLSYTVSRRRTELGIRMALGAGRRRVLMDVVGSGMRLAVVGLAIGLGLAWFAAGMTASLIEAASPRDPRLYATVAVGLALAALVANLLPARRASRTEPVSAMRND